MPELEIIRDELRLEMPDTRIELSAGGGGHDSWYVFAVTCYPVKDELIDNVALQIDICRLPSAPILQAHVWWEYAQSSECELFPQPVPASDEAIELIKNHLPELVAVWKEAARRGQPKSQDRILLNGAN